ncbi:sensor histidine kinase [Streptomyces sp. NEAU-Y11]|uniref:sensor histidine kinase n=1 Tax=Streptomyces cucumeris TaxID=2962890 RepID=UPI0020C91D20|nr:histidine kinase [Streptomyces sp. NEAU-Y11]MCP9206710.1 histidine kinase [Streptomyces sp. NEAU-Y11]
MIAAFRARSLIQRALICLVGAGLFALVVMEGRNAPYPAVVVATVVTGVLSLLALFAPKRWFRQYALAAAVASCALSITQTQLAQRPENTPGMVELGVLLLVITRAVRRSRPLEAIGLSMAASCAAVILPLRIEAWDDHLYLFISLIAVCVVPFMVVLGLALRLRDTVRAREIDTVRQAQRLEYARELHDFVAHHVTAIVAQTKAARFTADAGHTQSPEDLDRMLAQIEQAGAQALGSMRAMVSVLRDPVAPTAPAATRPAGHLGGLRTLTEKFSVAGPPATLTVDPSLTDRPVPPEVAATVYSVVQESLTNARKHAEGMSCVEVRVVPHPERPDRLEVSVTDDGRPGGQGTPPGQSAARAEGAVGGGYGLVGLAERVEGIGGRISAGERPGGGWCVQAVLPLDALPSY